MKFHCLQFGFFLGTVHNTKTAVLIYTFIVFLYAMELAEEFIDCFMTLNKLELEEELKLSSKIISCLEEYFRNKSIEESVKQTFEFQSFNTNVKAEEDYKSDNHKETTIKEEIPQDLIENSSQAKEEPDNQSCENGEERDLNSTESRNIHMKLLLTRMKKTKMLWTL